MTPRMFLLLLLATPLVELYFLIQIGGEIGAFATVVLVVVTAVVGVILVRAQSFAALLRVQQQLARGESPADSVLEGVALFIAGALLLTPGFVTDAIGFALVTPPIRRRIIASLLNRATRHHPARVIDVQAESDNEWEQLR